MHGHRRMKKKQNEKVCPEVQQWFGTTFTNNKAGMADVDKDKVKRVVYEMSKVRYVASFRRQGVSPRVTDNTTYWTALLHPGLYPCRTLLTSSMVLGSRPRQKTGSEK